MSTNRRTGKNMILSLKHYVMFVLVAFLLASLLIALLSAVSLLLQNRQKQEVESPFVSKVGPNLVVNGSILRLIGYNWRWLGTGCGAPTDTELKGTFAEIRNVSHGNVVRTAFYQSGSNGGSYTDFDRYIKYAKQYSLYIVPMLVNQWTSCEPSTTTKNASWYQSGYKETHDNYPLSFRDYAVRLAHHYANEPTIAFWQLVNEPDTDICGPQGAQILRNFADDMVTAIKAVDPHHMVELGVPAECSGDTIQDYTTIVSSKADLCDVWHDYNQPASSLPAQMQRIEVCQHLNKPAFVGESGICADITATGACSGTVSSVTLKQRAVFFNAKLAKGFAAGLAGYILWNKGDKSVGNDIGPGDLTEQVVAKYSAR